MVLLAVVGDALGRDRLQHMHQALQIVSATDLDAIGQVEDEVAEAEVLHQDPAQLIEQHR